jgi:hypothetical protein
MGSCDCLIRDNRLVVGAKLKQTVWKRAFPADVDDARAIRTADQGLIGSSEPDARGLVVRRRTNGAPMSGLGGNAAGAASHARSAAISVGNSTILSTRLRL